MEDFSELRKAGGDSTWERRSADPRYYLAGYGVARVEFGSAAQGAHVLISDRPVGLQVLATERSPVASIRAD
jgi:hypothetical protein